MRLLYSSTCFELLCSSSGGQILLYSIWYRHNPVAARCAGWEGTSWNAECDDTGRFI